MKHKDSKRILSILSAFAMRVCLVPAAENTAFAALEGAGQRQIKQSTVICRNKLNI